MYFFFLDTLHVKREYIKKKFGMIFFLILALMVQISTSFKKEIIKSFSEIAKIIKEKKQYNEIYKIIYIITLAIISHFNP